MEDYEEINNITMEDGDDMEGMENCIISWNEIIEQINWNRVMIGAVNEISWKIEDIVGAV